MQECSDHRLLCSRRILLADRLQRLHSTAGAAFLFGAGGWTLSTETCRLCNTLKGSCCVPWTPYKRGGGTEGHWHEWGLVATCVARSRARALGFPGYGVSVFSSMRPGAPSPMRAVGHRRETNNE